MASVVDAFDPCDTAFSRANALYLAHASDVAYLRAPITAARERLGLKAIQFRSKMTRTRGFLGVADTHAVLAFRGSDPVTLQNWVTDVVVRLVQRTDYDGRVHLGFAAALKRVWKHIDAALQFVGDRPLFLTGHSMGGALAVLAGCRLAKQGRPPGAIYTFGAPRVGDRNFCNGYRLNTFRVVNGLDLVPEMPLASLKRLLPAKPRFTNERILRRAKQIAARVPCYGHVRTLVHLTDGQILLNSRCTAWHAQAVRDAIDKRGKTFVTGITDHLMSSYIRKLESQPSDARSSGVRSAR
jgi:triacylglycerol lipase